MRYLKVQEFSQFQDLKEEVLLKTMFWKGGVTELAAKVISNFTTLTLPPFTLAGVFQLMPYPRLRATPFSVLSFGRDSPGCSCHVQWRPELTFYGYHMTLLQGSPSTPQGPGHSQSGEVLCLQPCCDLLRF
jgi:hypothetical protein